MYNLAGWRTRATVRPLVITKPSIMSVSQMAIAWRLDLPSTEKLVLLKLADCANDDGENAWPSIDTLSTICGVSERTVQYILRSFRESGLISVQEQATRYKPTVYRLELDRGATIAPIKRTLMGAKSAAMGATSFVSGVQPIAPDPSVQPSNDPSSTPAADEFGLTSDGQIIHGKLSPDDLVSIWNEHCGVLAAAGGMTAARRRACVARIKEFPARSTWVDAMRRLAASQWAQGRNPSKWTASFGWLIRPEKLSKVLEWPEPSSIGRSANDVRQQTRDANVAHVASGDFFVPEGVR